MKCSTCGTENDPANRFCDQCGSRLEPSGGFAQAQVAVVQQPVAVGPTCPSCGATVVPGEAFCDECGSSLSGVAPVAAAYDAPTMYSPPPESGAPAADQSSICQACGHQNLPGDRFCDNCGSSLAPAQASSPSITEAPTVAAGGGLAEAPTVTADADLLRELNAVQPVPTGADAQAPTQEPPADAAADAQAPTQERPVAVPPAPDEVPALDEVPSPDKAPTQEQLALDPSAAQSAYEAERLRLEEEIARQQQIIVQLEQMEAMFGAATPPAVRQGLTEARDAKARTEAELAALQPPPPPVDPAEVARLEEEIARQQQIIAQLEQMETMFGAAAPPAVRQGLTEARDAKARAEAELAALGTGAAAPSAVAAPPEAPAAPVSAPVEPPAVAQAPTAQPVQSPPPVVAPPVYQAAPADAPTELAPPQPVAPPPPPAPAPRLVVDETGKELAFPLDKREIIVGREDPISGIFPEIDLTAHGGETGGVSRQHARISRADGQWVIIDLNSTNYTRVNGNKINPSTPVPITNGAKIQFGRVALTFRE